MRVRSSSIIAATLAATQLSPTRATPVRAARVPISAPDTPTHDSRGADAVQTLGDLLGGLLPPLVPLLTGLGLYDATNPAALIDTASPAMQSAIQQVIQSLKSPNASGVTGTVSGVTGTVGGVVGGVPVVGGVANGVTSAIPGVVSGATGTASGLTGGLTSTIPGLGSFGAVRTNASNAQNAPRTSMDLDSEIDVFTAPRAPPNTPEHRSSMSPVQSPSPLHAFTEQGLGYGPAISGIPTKLDDASAEYSSGAPPPKDYKPLAPIPDIEEESDAFADGDEGC
ncbi:hypothetical protein CONPUDRAFT_141398 [Coniophora puteana RWD-64-598 SS2]|uniref:Uncharacterized protein n=1 Tax=Coniophora puteana (strain RWD-64-598) TaxID=741705 RepID=A0A5M3N6U3_CONPW|nr:uncharacterized protein CONPUDRAFT_141398 [Coniophora puteana RWD-64-598 SS2]EIW87159.1 hypothetical protein CONPUDRAFT_141398 [Coniophora puteana RWD-64-598 SS2]